MQWRDRQERKFLGFSFTDGPAVKRASRRSPGPFQGSNPGNHATGKGVSIKSTVEELLATWGLPRLLRLLRNSRGADLPHALVYGSGFSMRPHGAQSVSQRL